MGELSEIVIRRARKLKVEITAEAAMEIASRSCGNPRVATSLLHWVRDYASAKADGEITLGVTTAALKMATPDSIS